MEVQLGFFCPMISKNYEQVKNVLLIGAGFSLVIEISQLFTLHRATDINDIISNTLGAVIGCLCFKFIVKLKDKKSVDRNEGMEWMPILYLAGVFIITFIQL